MQLTKNFHLDEFTKSMYATRHKLDNDPPGYVIDNLARLCEQLLQPLRDSYGKPIVIASGYRSRKVNEGIGGSTNSQHMTGEAADIDTTFDNKVLFDLIKDNLEWDQLIWEHGAITKPEWVHVSYTPINRRKEILRAYYDSDGILRYEPFDLY